MSFYSFQPTIYQCPFPYIRFIKTICCNILPHDNNFHLFYNPSNKIWRTNLLNQRYLKSTSSAYSFSYSRSFSCVHDKLWVISAMDGSKRTAFREGENNEHAKVLEQEGFVDGFSQFKPKFWFQEVESTLNQLSKWIVTGIFGIFILWRHDAEALWFAGGSILNAMLSIFLKQMLNQKRPSTLKSTPGMPSSHAQSIFFTLMFIILSNVEWLGIGEFTLTSSSMALAFGSYFSYLRVSQKLHTVSQVVVGAVVGSICSILWYQLWNVFMLDFYVSYLWVRIIVVLGSAGVCLGFFLHVIYHWLKDK